MTSGDSIQALLSTIVNVFVASSLVLIHYRVHEVIEWCLMKQLCYASLSSSWAIGIDWENKIQHFSPTLDVKFESSSSSYVFDNFLRDIMHLCSASNVNSTCDQLLLRPTQENRQLWELLANSSLSPLWILNTHFVQFISGQASSIIVVWCFIPRKQGLPVVVQIASIILSA